MSMDLDPVKEKFEGARDRLFEALGLEDKWRDGAGNAPLSTNEKRIPGTNIILMRYRDCCACFRVEVNNKQVYMELIAKLVMSSTGAARDPQSMMANIPSVDARPEWFTGNDFDVFAKEVGRALTAGSARL